jgi:hypothetical protein
VLTQTCRAMLLGLVFEAGALIAQLISRDASYSPPKADACTVARAPQRPHTGKVDVAAKRWEVRPKNISLLLGCYSLGRAISANMLRLGRPGGCPQLPPPARSQKPKLRNNSKPQDSSLGVLFCDDARCFNGRA